MQVELKKKVFDILFPHNRLAELIDYLDKGKLLLARSIIHDILIENEPNIDYIRDDGEMIIHNAKVKKYKDISSIYSDVMQEIEKKDEKKIKEMSE